MRGREGQSGRRGGGGQRGQRGAGSQPGTLAGFLPLYPLGFSENVSKFSLSREDRLPACAVASSTARGISEDWATHFIFMHKKRGGGRSLLP